MTPLRREVERLLEAGSCCGVPKTAGACRDILKRREALWTCVQVAGVEPTNNAAEVRSVDQKPSGQLGGLVPR
jgi:transposase